MEKRFSLKIAIGHLALSTSIALLGYWFSDFPFWACFLMSEFAVLFNGWISFWGDRRSKKKVAEMIKNGAKLPDPESKQE